MRTGGSFSSLQGFHRSALSHPGEEALGAVIAAPEARLLCCKKWIPWDPLRRLPRHTASAPRPYRSGSSAAVCGSPAPGGRCRYTLALADVGAHSGARRKLRRPWSSGSRPEFGSAVLRETEKTRDPLSVVPVLLAKGALQLTFFQREVQPVCQEVGNHKHQGFRRASGERGSE